MEFTERELTIIKCALSDYQFQFVDDTSNQDLLEEIVEIINKRIITNRIKIIKKMLLFSIDK